MNAIERYAKKNGLSAPEGVELWRYVLDASVSAGPPLPAAALREVIEILDSDRRRFEKENLELSTELKIFREALQKVSSDHCVRHKGDVSCAETDVPTDKYCGPCYARFVLTGGV